MRLDIGNIYEWYKNPMTNYVSYSFEKLDDIWFQLMPISWYPRNFTNPSYMMSLAQLGSRLSDDAIYAVQLGLYVVGYREYKDDEVSSIKMEILKYKFVDQKIPTWTSNIGVISDLFESKRLRLPLETTGGSHQSQSGKSSSSFHCFHWNSLELSFLSNFSMFLVSFHQCHFSGATMVFERLGADAHTLHLSSRISEVGTTTAERPKLDWTSAWISHSSYISSLVVDSESTTIRPNDIHTAGKRRKDGVRQTQVQGNVSRLVSRGEELFIVISEYLGTMKTELFSISFETPKPTHHALALKDKLYWIWVDTCLIPDAPR